MRGNGQEDSRVTFTNPSLLSPNAEPSASVLPSTISVPDTNLPNTTSSAKDPVRTFSVFNVRGLHPSSVPSKVPYVSDHLLEKNQLFIGLTETWLGSHKDAELKIDGYKLFRSDRKRRKRCKRGRLSGGVAAYVHNDMAHQMEEKLKFTNGVVEVLGLYSSVENLFIGIVYHQPDDLIGGNCSTITEFKPALEKLQQAIDE